jgi:tripartite-type tricarboxylate transporter receptor subunit TctC
LTSARFGKDFADLPIKRVIAGPSPSQDNNVAFATMPASIQYIRSGKLRALAVTTATRLEALPDIPAVNEFVAGYELSVCYGIGAPRNTPL